jgi:hypothetical protein
MISNHFYTRYGLALLMQEKNISQIEDITPTMLGSLIQTGLDHFRLQPIVSSEDNDKIKFQYAKEKFLSNNTKYISKHCNEGFYLSPNIITIDLQAMNSWRALLKTKKMLLENVKLTKSEKATMSIMPLTSKFNNGKTSQSSPSVSFLEACLCLITTSTPYKPALHTREKISYISTAIIPDLELNDMVKFISLFKDMQLTQVNNMMEGSIKREEDKLEYRRPNLSNGNFPHAPRRPELASAALLGAIGRFAKATEYPNTNAEEVLEKLINRPIYIISYGKAQSVTYNHYIVDLAKNNRLNTIIDALGRFVAYSSDTKNKKNIKQKRNIFFLFASRFLQLFDKQSFREFIATRGEYPKELKVLLTTYYRNVMKIDPKVINSAHALGHWLNQIAYFASANENKGKSYQDITDGKAKIIVELESSAFSAKTPTALVSQIITRAGRISGQDAPKEVQLFIQKVIAGELGESEKESLENAKNMIVVFSRIRSSKEEPTIESDTMVEEVTEDEIQLTEEEQELN